MSQIALARPLHKRANADRRYAVLLVLLLASCAPSRPLTETERAFAAMIHGPMLDVRKVRLHDGAPTLAVTFKRKPRPRTTCRDLIFPPAPYS